MATILQTFKTMFTCASENSFSEFFSYHEMLNSFMTESYHIETGLLICRANQWTGFYMIGTSIMKELM